MQFWRRDDKESLEVDCPICKVGPGNWCVYVGNVYRAGMETQRLHVERRHQLWLKRPVFAPKKHRRTAAVVSVHLFDRAEELALRDWLRQHVHLLLDLAPPSPETVKTLGLRRPRVFRGTQVRLPCRETPSCTLPAAPNLAEPCHASCRTMPAEPRRTKIPPCLATPSLACLAAPCRAVPCHSSP